MGQERYTFSSLMTSLIETERMLGRLYEETAQATNDLRLRTLLTDLGKKSSKRTDVMQRARVESVIEIALEPISGLHVADLFAPVRATIENGKAGSLERLVSAERLVSELYSRASPKVAQISADASDALMSFSQESAERATELEKYIKPT